MSKVPIASEIIKKKRDGKALSQQEISEFIISYTECLLPDYQMSALLMAIFLNGMSEEETLALTGVMLHSGKVMDFRNIPVKKVDKHSTGGVGDKTSLILGPIVATGGLAVPMISGRGLGHTGGTLDKLESIPGFNTQLSLDRFRQTVKENYISFIGQTNEICPADKKIYALRDVTGTVESLPLICASIMSKKLAEGLDALVFDVKFGSGAFMKTKEEAEELALNLCKIARGYGKKVSALLSRMDQPLGQYAGNSLEVEECVAILKGERRPIFEDTRELSLQLAARMFFLGEAVPSLSEAYHLAEKILVSGKAMTKFEELCRSHGGRLSQLPKPQQRVDIFCPLDGFIQGFDTQTIGMVGVKIKAGRFVTTDLIEPTAGFEFHKKIGDRVSKGDILFSMYGADRALLREAEQELSETVQISENKTPALDLIWKEI